MRLELERGLELFFQIKLKQTITHQSFYVFCVVPLLLLLKEHL
jgi:hypothetical protein